LQKLEWPRQPTNAKKKSRDLNGAEKNTRAKKAKGRDQSDRVKLTRKNKDEDTRRRNRREQQKKEKKGRRPFQNLRKKWDRNYPNRIPGKAFLHLVAQIWREATRPKGRHGASDV